MNKISTKCIVCGKERARGSKSFCSRSCFYKYQDKRLTLICPCGTKFKIKKVEIERGRGKFCSSACYWESLKGKGWSPGTRFKKGNKPWNKGLKGKDYLSKEALEKMAVWKGKSGEGTSNWKGGTTPLGQSIRSLNCYKKWREAIFQRDNWTCQHCGTRCQKGNKVIIHADHIKPFYKILEENKIKSVEQAKQCKELWDVNNGRTLCILCHKQTSSYLVNQYTK